MKKTRKDQPLRWGEAAKEFAIAHPHFLLWAYRKDLGLTEEELEKYVKRCPVCLPFIWMEEAKGTGGEG